MIALMGANTRFAPTVEDPRLLMIAKSGRADEGRVRKEERQGMYITDASGGRAQTGGRAGRNISQSEAKVKASTSGSDAREGLL